MAMIRDECVDFRECDESRFSVVSSVDLSEFVWKRVSWNLTAPIFAIIVTHRII